MLVQPYLPRILGWRGNVGVTQIDLKLVKDAYLSVLTRCLKS